MMTNQPIGFFDSGLGGLSVLSSAMKRLPYEHFLYLGDSLNAPYGTKSERDVLALTEDAVQRLASQGIKALVIACNTATGAALETLKKKYSFPIIGIEPDLQSACKVRQNGLILVLATPLTLKSKNYQDLYRKYGEYAVSLPCPGLMEFVEHEELSCPDLEQYLDELLSPYQKIQIDAAVLGCTHYLFLKSAIKMHLPENVRIIDSNNETTRQLINELTDHNLVVQPGRPGSVSLSSTGGEEKTKQMYRMLLRAQQTS
jgi:glutamate racemase